MERKPDQIKIYQTPENIQSTSNKRPSLGQYKLDDLREIESERMKFAEEWQYRSELRRQKEPLWENQGAQLPEKERKFFVTMLEEVIKKEKNTQMEVAMEEALKMDEDITELVKEGKTKNFKEACAIVEEKKEFQLKDKERIEKEESVRPYFILVERALERDDLEMVQGIIGNLSPEIKDIFSAVQDNLDRLFEKKQKQYIEKGEEENLAKLMATRSFVSNQFSMKNINNVDDETKKSPVFINAAKNFLADKLNEIINLSKKNGIEEYIWIRNEIVSAGIVSAEEIDSNPDTQWKLKTILVGVGESGGPFFSDQIERYKYLKSQLELAGIFRKNEVNHDPRIQEALSSLLDGSLDESVVLSDEETFNRYKKVRQLLSRYKIIEKKEMDWNAKMQENFYKLLLKQFSLNTSGEEKINRFVDFFGKMSEEKMIMPEIIKVWNKDNKLLGELKNSMDQSIGQCPKAGRKELYLDLTKKIADSGMATFEIISSWKILENQPE